MDIHILPNVHILFIYLFILQEDMETAKYVWRMCVARHKFYRLNKCSL